MKLLRVQTTGYKGCRDRFTVDFVSKAPISLEDQTYELTRLDEDLYVLRSTVFVGKNASGKSTALDFLNLCYTLLSEFRLNDPDYAFSDLGLTMYLYHEKMIYRYRAHLHAEKDEARTVTFSKEQLAVKPYRKSKRDELFAEEDFQEQLTREELPKEVSALSRILKKEKPRAFYLTENPDRTELYHTLYDTVTAFGTEPEVLKRIVKLFDPNLVDLEPLSRSRVRVTRKGKTVELTDTSLGAFLSGGTLRGTVLYLYCYHALKDGMDLLVDEPEMHLQKALLQNVLNLFQDTRVNRHGASFLFATQYAEILDYPARSDGIWIAKADNGVHLENMYETGLVRPNQNKDRLYYENAFHTAVDYEDLIRFKDLLFTE